MTGAPSLGLSVQQLVPRARVAPLIADARACSSFQPAAMDFWPSAGGPLSPNGAGSDLNLLNDSLLIDLDDKTLQASDKLSAGGLCGRGARAAWAPPLSPPAALRLTRSPAPFPPFNCCSA